MQILLVKSEKEVRSVIMFLLETELGVQVKEAATLQDGLAFLLDDKLKFDVLICDDNVENQKLFKYLMSGDMQIRCLVLKDPKVPAILAFPDLIVAHVNPAKAVEEIKAVFTEKLNMAKPEPVAGNDASYCRIRAITVMKKSPLFSDVFLRLSPQKYVRVFKKGDSFTESDIESFLQRKQIEFVYLLKEDALEFAKQLKESIERQFNAANTSPEEATRSVIAAQEAVIELGNRIGLTPDVQELAKQGMKVTLRIVATAKPQLQNILKGIFAHKDSYIGAHPVLTAQVACCLATGLDWISETTFQKLTFASFFHDMILTNNKLAQVKDLKDLEARKTEFTEHEIKTYTIHPAGAAQIIRTFTEVPPDVDTIISQHHERPDGSGFPRGLNAQNITPPSALFIVAHDLVDHIFENGTEGIDAFLDEYKKKYSIGHFKKILTQIDLQKAGLSEVSKTPPTLDS